MKRILLALAVVVLLQGSALAAPADPSGNPVLAAWQKMGAKLFFIGSHAGLNGWFIVKDGQVQIAYTTPDNKNALVGALFGENGENITAAQITELLRTNKDVASMIASAQKEQVLGPQAANMPAAAPLMPSHPDSPGEKLMRDLAAAATVTVGSAASPEILMVMDPRCPHCQATWKMLRDSVTKGSLHLRMIPIGNVNSDNERAAAVFLGVADPLNVWDKYVGGDKTVLAGTPPDSALSAVRANHALVDSWKIKETPYLVYRGKDGQVKVVIGEPDKISAVLGDLGG